MTQYKFITYWDENGFDSQKTNRIELNKIIAAYNSWQIEDDFDKDKSKKLLAKIEYGKQTIGSQDGGGFYWDELDSMEKFVKEKTIQ